MSASHPPHGGDLAAATAEFGEPEQGWIDLSTGISPWSWPVPAVPEAVWRRLPPTADGLLPNAAAYYHTTPERLLAVPGSQYAIGVLPTLFERATVALPRWGYREHEHAWRHVGHDVFLYDDLAHLGRLIAQGTVRHAIVINPNNPTATLAAPRVLGAIADRLAAREGRLIVDEAFADAHPACSVVPATHAATIVLRSLGKYFGLAGLRLGFVAATPDLLARIETTMEPWAVAHPARWVATQALADWRWHQAQRARLRDCSRAWVALLRAMIPELSWHRTALFASARLPLALAEAMRRAAGQQGVLLRIYCVSTWRAEEPEPTSALLRLGLPHPGDIPRVRDALQAARRAL